MGVGTAVLALAKAFSDSNIDNQRYTFIVREDMRDWLAPYIYGPCTLSGIPATRGSVLKTLLGRIAPLKFIWQKVRGGVGHIPISDGYIESERFDIVHFPTQMAYLTDIPSIYQPWDLQHIHYPQFFSKTDFALRERYYRTFCDRATFVSVQAEWTRQDVINCYGIASEKVVVVPWGSVLSAYEAPSAKATQTAIEKYGLPTKFFFYPAVTWPHKNHEVILRALQHLRLEDGCAPHVYFTGSSTDYRQELDKLAQGLGVTEQVHFLGFLTPEELQAVFGTATAMIFASKFEGFGLPILEAFHARLPVISSNATTLPEVARDAALYFDPNSPAELAELMRKVWNAPEIRQGLIEKGTQVLLQYSMNDTVTNFQALYERAFELSSQSDHLSDVMAKL
jgi:glycosyltransferase involved in cell wall biosynthesis